MESHRWAVGVRGFEPPTPCSQSRCATRLRHTPTNRSTSEVPAVPRSVKDPSTRCRGPDGTRATSMSIAQAGLHGSDSAARVGVARRRDESLNKVMLIGNLGRTPRSGTRRAARRSRTSAWRPPRSSRTATAATPEDRVAPHRRLGPPGRDRDEYLRKGHQVYIEGRIQTRQWEDQQGQKRYTTEIVANEHAHARRPRRGRRRTRRRRGRRGACERRRAGDGDADGPPRTRPIPTAGTRPTARSTRSRRTDDLPF